MAPGSKPASGLRAQNPGSKQPGTGGVAVLVGIDAVRSTTRQGHAASTRTGNAPMLQGGVIRATGQDRRRAEQKRTG